MTDPYINPKKNDFERILNNLMKYPFFDTNPRISQDFGRCKAIRFYSRNGRIKIKQGSIGIPNKYRLVKTRYGYKIVNK